MTMPASTQQQTDEGKFELLITFLYAGNNIVETLIELLEMIKQRSAAAVSVYGLLRTYSAADMFSKQDFAKEEACKLMAEIEELSEDPGGKSFLRDPAFWVVCFNNSLAFKRMPQEPKRLLMTLSQVIYHRQNDGVWPNDERLIRDTVSAYASNENSPFHEEAKLILYRLDHNDY